MPAGDKELENLTTGPGISLLLPGRQIVQIGAIMIELSQIALGENQVLRVERFKVAIEEFNGGGFIEGLLQIVQFLEQFRSPKGDLAIEGAGSDLIGIRGLRLTLRGGRFLLRDGGRRRLSRVNG